MAAKLDSAELLYVACSGGADSVFALLLLRLYFEETGRLDVLRVLHFDHDLRLEASAADAVFVSEMSAALRIPFLDAKADWTGCDGKVSEASAREARLAFFKNATGCSQQSPALIATGHHADDVVETLLMRLSRGAGLQGLSAPREVSDAGSGLVFVRPILDWGRSEICSALEQAGVPWREDETNASDQNYRARLRKRVIPVWEAAADRPIRPGVVRSRRLLAEDAAALDYCVDSFWASSWDEAAKVLRRDVVERLPLGIRRRLLTRLSEGAEVNADAMELALAALESGELLKLEIGKGLFFEFSADGLSLKRVDLQGRGSGWEPFLLPFGSIAYLPDGARLSCERVELDESTRAKVISGCNDDRRIVYLDASGNSSPWLLVRTRAMGDAFKPLGKSSPKKLKNLFIDRKIDRIERDCLPVFVCEESGILWVPGIPPNADRKLGFASGTALRLTYEK